MLVRQHPARPSPPVPKEESIRRRRERSDDVSYPILAHRRLEGNRKGGVSRMGAAALPPCHDSRYHVDCTLLITLTRPRRRTGETYINAIALAKAKRRKLDCRRCFIAVIVLTLQASSSI